MAALPLAIASLLLLDPAGARGAAEQALVPGQAATHELAGGQERTHVIGLGPGEFLRLAVVQQGIDVVVTLAGPEGGMREVDVARGHHGREPASILAGSAGVHRITVRARHPGVVAGRYLLETDGARQPDARDRTRAAGEGALADGARQARTGRPEARRAGVARLEEARRALRSLEDRHGEAEALLALALARTALGDHGPALEDAAGALEAWRAVGDQAGEARALQASGQVQYNQSQYDAAFERWDGALALRRALTDRWGIAETLTSLGMAHAERSRADQGLPLAQEAVGLWRALGDAEGEGRALSNLGEVQVHRREMQAGVDLFMQALSVQQAAGDRRGEAASLGNLGFMRQTLGDPRGGLEFLQRALPLWRELGDLRGEANALNNMGFAYVRLDDTDQALSCYEQALRAWREANDPGRMAVVLVNLGHLHVKKGQPERALPYQSEALAIFREGGNRSAEAITLMNLGNAHLAAGRRQEARRHYEPSLELKRQLGDEVGQAIAQYWIARVHREEGELERARAALEAALETMEAERRRVSTLKLGNPYGASISDMYELYVDVLMALHRAQPEGGYAERALHASEAARARALLELLREARADIRQGIDPALLGEERALQDRLSLAVEDQMRLLRERHTAEQAQEAALAVQAHTIEVEGVRARLRAASARHAALDQPDLLTTERIRQELLDGETVLLEYSLGRDRSFLWVVGRGSVAAHELPPRAAIEEAARRAYGQLSRRRPGPAAEAALADLGRMVLGPAAAALAAARRLLVVPDGALHYVPFAALTAPGAAEPLVARHEVVAAPSASALAALRRERRQRPPAPKALMVLADPVFDRSDARLPAPARPAAAAPPAEPDLDRAARDAGVSALPRLPFTRREAGAVLALVPPAQRKGALDFEASRATVTGSALHEYRIVHFATHGFLNSARPELSGIVLSLVNRRGRDERGFITTADVFGLRLAADLVVLSGCRTALGSEIKGEGLVGLTRGFMYAGASRVMASLWKVDDEATAALMGRLYQEMLGPSRRPPAEALRAAQAWMRQQRRWRAPYYWAAFQLQGEWN